MEMGIVIPSQYRNRKQSVTLWKVLTVTFPPLVPQEGCFQNTDNSDGNVPFLKYGSNIKIYMGYVNHSTGSVFPRTLH